MVTTGPRISALVVIALFACHHTTGQRITTIQLDGTQYYISRMNPYSAELNYFLAYEYCRSIGLQLASFETLEKTTSISDFLKNAGYHKFDYWTSGNRLGTDMLIWMSTGLPFNTTFNQMKQPSANGGLDADELSMKPVLPIARKKRGDSGSRDGCVALKAPTMDWVTADCTDLKDFICEQTRCYYYNYGSIPVSSSQGFGYKSRPTINSLFSSAHSDDHSTSSNAPTTLTTSTTTTTETYEEPSGIQQIPDNILSRSADPEAEAAASTPGQADDSSPTATTTEQQQQQYFQETQTAVVDQQQQQVSTDAPSTAATAADDSYTTTLPTLIQMHNQQQQQQQQEGEEEQAEDRPQTAEQQRQSQPEAADSLQGKPNAFAFESLEKAFATAVPHKIRATKDLEQRLTPNDDGDQPQLPWSWAKDIMLQKPVLKKTSQEVA